MAVPLKGRKRISFTGEELPGSIPSDQARLRILHLNPEHIAEIHSLVPDGFFSSVPVVIVPYWETENIPRAAIAQACHFDEVWCTTRFLAEAFGKGFGIPLRSFPAPLAIPASGGYAVGERFRFDDRFVFLFSFDYFSCIKRKNPDGLCEAFVRAFPVQEPGGPVLVVKSTHAEEHPTQDIYLKLRFCGRKDILFIDGILADDERAALFQRCNAYVSLHRSEGLGMTILEAMAIGKPCIATAYSGNLDFTLPEHSYPIPFRKTRIGPGSIHYPPEEEWADPDLDAAATAMRECVMNPAEAGAKGLKAGEWVAEHHRFEAVGGILLGMIDDLLARPHDAAAKQRRLDEAGASNQQFPGNQASAAYALLRQARDRIKAAEDLLDAVPKKQQPLRDACRQLARSNRLLAASISGTLKAQKEAAAKRTGEQAIKEHFDMLVMKAIADKLRG